MLVYDTDTRTFWYRYGTTWVEMATGGTEIAETSVYSTDAADNTIFVQWVDTPGLGTFTYTLRERAGGGYTVNYGSMLTAVVYK